MKLIDQPPPPAPASPSDRRSAPIAILAVVAILGAVVIFGLIITFSTRRSPSAVEPSGVPVESSSVADEFFGQMGVGAGSSVDSGIGGGILSVDQIDVIESPEGIDVDLYDSDMGPRIEIAVADDVVPGPHSLLFSIEGIPEPVTWVIDVLEG